MTAGTHELSTFLLDIHSPRRLEDEILLRIISEVLRNDRDSKIFTAIRATKHATNGEQVVVVYSGKKKLSIKMKIGENGVEFLHEAGALYDPSLTGAHIYDMARRILEL